jgi:hypothetical protein
VCWCPLNAPFPPLYFTLLHRAFLVNTAVSGSVIATCVPCNSYTNTNSNHNVQTMSISTHAFDPNPKNSKPKSTNQLPKETLKKELRNKSNKALMVRFKGHTQVSIPKNILEIIQINYLIPNLI